ncbi:von Willebrand factor A domain-containing protein 7-like [Sardina pilchardus]|uniref:von Willebrand factor A domain-containing protein 7-like n=1 Tax=Sardina pilchardus TaxID=27697 RepID=UPI002E0EA6E6
MAMDTRHILWLFTLFSTLRGTLATSVTHLQMMESAILQATTAACTSHATRTGKAFVLPPGPVSAEALVKACSSSSSAVSFRMAITEISLATGSTGPGDRQSVTFSQWRKLITDDIAAVKLSVQKKNFESAKAKLGEVLYALQNVYGHGDPIELENKLPYSTLKRLAVPIRNDLTSWQRPTPTISKDGQEIATKASVDLLQDIRAAVGDADFLRLMRMSQTSSSLCIVIDTTGSMSDDISVVRQTATVIIDSKKGTPDEPSDYYLIPFNDPGFGPVFKTTDAGEFQTRINRLTANGGGDEPEMSLSALQLALTSTPSHSNIFLFTDASAKDSSLKSTDQALIEKSKSTVNFLLTNPLGRRRRNADEQQQSDEQEQEHSEHVRERRALSATQKRIYEELARASGGLAVEVTKKTLPMATSIITDASSSAMVTVFQAVRVSGSSEEFKFQMDTSLSHLAIYITGHSLTFTITSAKGVSQASTQTKGALGNINKVGNLYTMHINADVQKKGLWVIKVQTSQSYTVKVVGQSPIDFLYNFVEVNEGTDSFVFLDSRPSANAKATLLVAITMPDSVRVTEVAMVQEHGTTVLARSLKKTALGSYFATVDRVPEGSFAVQVKGMILTGSFEIFQRQSSTQLKASGVTVTAQTTANLKPGIPLSIPFTVASEHFGGTFTVKARNDRKFTLTSPSRVAVSAGGRTESRLTIKAPAVTPSGTDVTLTIEVQGPGGDSNYAVLRLTVLAEVTDSSPPDCQVTSVDAECFGDCSLSTWKMFAELTDGKGSGIKTITVQEGTGTLSTTVKRQGGVEVTQATYSASCCSEKVELAAVDAAGNVGTCSWAIKKESFWHPYCT